MHIRGWIILAAALGGGWLVVARDDPATPRPRLDHSKPWYVRKGWPMCVTLDDLEKAREAAAIEASKSLKEKPNAMCFPALEDTPAVEVARQGTLEPDYQVRVTFGQGTSLFWVPGAGIRN